MTISMYPSPVANAGGDLQHCGVEQIGIAGSPSTGSWSLISGPGGIIGNAGSAITTFQGSVQGAYTLRWTATAGTCSAHDDVVITLWNHVTTPVISGGGPVCGLTSATLTNNEITVGGIHWQMEVDNGPGGSLVVNRSGATVIGLMGQAYGVNLRVTNGACSEEDYAMVTFNPNPTAANAGQDQANLSACGVTKAALSANTPSVLESGSWSVAGKSDVTGFSDPSSPTSQFTGAKNGRYTLRWTTTRGACTSSDDVVISFTDQTLCEGQNYHTVIAVQKKDIKTIEDLSTLQVGDIITTTAYFDGLGRVTQSITKQNSPGFQDIVQPILYDEFGREATKYLPYTSTETTGAFKNNSLSDQASFYLQGGTIPYDASPYAKIVFEPSPLNRPLKQGAPGAVWQPDPDPTNFNDNTIKKKYGTNTSSEVILFSYDASSGLLTVSNDDAQLYYAASQLADNTTLDEHSNEVIEYTDKRGHLVCKKVQVGTVNNLKQYASTYYIYDDFDNLAVVLPPEAVQHLLGSLVHH
jgi:hypothetical protein